MKFVIFFDEIVSVYDHVTLIPNVEGSTIAYMAEQSLRTAKAPNYVGCFSWFLQWMKFIWERWEYPHSSCGTLPETSSLPLKIDGWKMIFLSGWPIFRGELLVSGRVHGNVYPFFYPMVPP